MQNRDLVFFSYRHDKDGERWLAALHGMLEPYVLDQNLVAWSDRNIRTGEQWHGRIQSAIDRTRVAVLLVNHRFFGSTYICQHELPRLVADAHAGHLRLFIVVIGAVDPALMVKHGLSAFQAANPPSRPMNGLRGTSLDKALVAVAVAVREAYDALAEQSALEPSALALRHGDEPGPSTCATAPGPLLDVPDYNPARYVARPDDIAALRAVLVEGTELALGITSTASGLGLHGMGGMGKSVLALALCYDDALRRAYPDGIVWVALGQTPDLLAVQNRLLRLLNPQAQPAETQAEASRRLRQVLQDRRVLLVVDDVWDLQHIRGLDVVQGRSRLLMTTRDATVLSLVGARTYGLKRLPQSLARELLTLRSGCALQELPPEADEVIEHTGGLPLALALGGAQIADGLSWTTLVDELRQGHVDFLDHAYGSIYASLGRSVDALPAADRERYFELAVFPEEEAIPMAVVARLWQHRGELSAARTEQLLVRLDCMALLTLTGRGAERTLALHDLQLDFVRWRVADLAALHRALLDAHRPSTHHAELESSCWSRLPPHTPYLWPRLATHLSAAGLDGELEDMLLDADWIRARLAVATTNHAGRLVADVAALLRDFETGSASPVVRRLSRAVQASAQRLIRHPAGLDQCLHGRLAYDEGRLGHLAAACRANLGSSGLWTPGRPGLTAPGAMTAVLSDNAGEVVGALVLPDDRTALSWHDDGTLRLWNLDGATEPRIFVGCKSEVKGAQLLSDSRQALSWHGDGTLCLWDLDGATEPRMFVGHQDSVNGVLLLPDGRRALSWSDDGTLRLWGLESTETNRILNGHKNRVTGALLLRDGCHALSWSDDGALWLWGLESGARNVVVGKHRERVNGASMLPDGCHALSWSDDGSLRLWNLDRAVEEGYALESVLEGHHDPVHLVLLLPDGRRALSWSYDLTLRLWDLDGIAESCVLDEHDELVTGAILQPSGERLLSWSADGTMRIWELNSAGWNSVLDGRRSTNWPAVRRPDDEGDLLRWINGTLKLWELDRLGWTRLLKVHQSRVNGALLLPDGRRAVTWSNDHTLRLWNLDDASEAQVLTGHESSVNGVLLLSKGSRALSWSDSTLRVWDLESAAEHRSLAGHQNTVVGALLLPDGRCALSWAADSTLRVWDLDTASELRLLPVHQEAVLGALLLPDGLRVLSWSADFTLRLWHLNGNTAPSVVALNRARVKGVLLSPNGQWALLWAGDGTLRWCVVDGLAEPRVRTWFAYNVCGALLLPDDRHALLWFGEPGTYKCTLCLWDLTGAGEVRVFAGHKAAVNGAFLLPDGRRALSWSADGTLRLWNLDDAAHSHVFSGHKASVGGVLLLPGDRRALSWSHDGTLRLWNLDDPSRHRVLEGHESGVNDVQLLSDGHHALSLSDDGTLRLWNLDVEAEPRVFSGHDGSVTGALLMPDGHRVLSWSSDRTLRLWDLSRAKEVARYDSDAIVSAVVVTRTSPWRIFVGDTIGFVQILTLRV